MGGRKISVIERVLPDNGIKMKITYDLLEIIHRTKISKHWYNLEGLEVVLQCYKSEISEIEIRTDVCLKYR